MKHVVSFSLWGTSPVYLQGALSAVDQVHQSYPGWEPRFYLGHDVPSETRRALENAGALTLPGPELGPWSGMFWRFLAASDPSVGVMISRDVDTEILPREVAAVHEWLDSGKTLHIMRDHPKHEMPIMGGMWGCRTASLRDMETLIQSSGKFDRYGRDQEFLSKFIYPTFRDDSWIHTECITFPGEAIHPFPTSRHGDEFIGISQTGDEFRLELQIRYLRDWINAGSPIYLRPLPWSLKGLFRTYSRGRFMAGKSLPSISA